MKRLLRSYVYNGFVWELNCSTSGELNDDKSSMQNSDWTWRTMTL
jgi:hypothetical protein